MLELLIIGAGPTGLYAAFLAGLRKLKAAVVESSMQVGGQLMAVYKEKAIYDIPGFSKILAGEFIDNAYQQYKRFEKDIPIYLDQEVLHINKKENYYEVITHNKTFNTKTVLIAHGGGSFVPQKLKSEKEFNNVLYYVENIASYKDKKMVILGGGDSALDWAISLLNVTDDVTLIHRRHTFRALLSSVQEYKAKGRTLTPYIIEDIIGDDNINSLVVKNLDDNTTLKIDADYVVVNYGFLLAKNKLAHWNLAEDKGLLVVNSKMESSQNGIYGAGNGVTYPGKVKLISSGLGDAATAINSILEYLHPERSTNFIHSSAIIES